MNTRLITTLLLAGMMCLTTRALWSQQPQADPFGPSIGPAAADPFGPSPAPVSPQSELLQSVPDEKVDFKRLAWWMVSGSINQMQIINKPKPCELKLVDKQLGSDVRQKMSPAARVRHLLDQQVLLTLNQVSLGDLSHEVSTKCQLNVIVDKLGLEEAAFDSTTPIDWHTEQPIKLRRVLQHVLGDLHLSYYIEEGALVITTVTAAESRMIVRTYPVDPELLKTRKRLVRRSFTQFGGYGGGGYFNVGEGGGGLYFGGSSPPLHAEYVELDSLVNLLTSLIQPTTWRTNGGLGHIEPNLQLGLLVVSNTEQVHDELAALLDVFKAKLAERKPPPVSPDAVERGIHPVVLPAVRLKQQKPLDHDRPISREPAFTMEQLVVQLKQQIEPASWQNPRHTITTLGQNLIIEQTRANHAKIAAFLKQLGITKEQVDDERQFAEEQEQARKDLLLRQAQERERIEKEHLAREEAAARQKEEERKKKEREAEEEKKRREQMK